MKCWATLLICPTYKVFEDMRYRRSRTAGATFFFTVVTYQRKKVLCLDENANLVKQAFATVKERHPFKIDAIALLPDHIHCIWTLPQDDRDFSNRWMLIKSYFTRQCKESNKNDITASRISKREQCVWQRRFWEHQIRDEKDFKAHVDYIHYNPVKHGLVKSPKDWLYSSFHREVKAGMYDNDWGVNNEVEFDAGVGHE